ncbi:hypothetical protein ACFROC_13280 [Nocardia tengchongensis]|uniref:hypothetical protein n=1 Tax=Nocardia tengchongensis TaxID=2055889 RepID=UPI0036A91645
MTTERSAADTAETATTPETVTVVAGRRRWWPWAILLVVVALAVAAVTTWLVTKPHTKSPEAAARDDLKSAQLALINAPGVHFTGSLLGKDAKGARLDLRITNDGVVSGTFDYGFGKTLTYLVVDGKAFLQGGRDAWIAHGFIPESADWYQNEQVLRTTDFLDVDVPAQLKPERLGRRLGPGPDQADPVTLGASTLIDGRSADGVISGGVTTYLVSGHARRITDPNFDVLVTPMNADEVAQFYRDLRPTVTALDRADNTETRVSAETSWSTPCGPACSALAVLTSTPQPFVSITLPGVTPHVDDIFVSYQMSLTIGGVETPRPDCSGVLQMPGNGTAPLSCGFTAGPGQTVSSTLTARPILGRARADALVAAFDTSAKQSGERAKCTITSLSESATPHC